MSRILSFKESRSSRIVVMISNVLLLINSGFSQEPRSNVLKNSLNMTMVEIKKGDFVMGGTVGLNGLMTMNCHRGHARSMHPFGCNPRK